MPARSRSRRRTRPARQIAEVPREERPRERLLKNGAQSLSDAELLAVVLKNGLAWGPALDLTRDLLTDTGGLADLTVASALALRRQGVGDVQLAAPLAAVELACRMAEARMLEPAVAQPTDLRGPLRSPPLRRPRPGGPGSDLRRHPQPADRRPGDLPRHPQPRRRRSAGDPRRRDCCAGRPGSCCFTAIPAATPRRARRTSSSPAAWPRPERSSVSASSTT